MIIRRATLTDFDGYYQIKADLQNIRWGGWKEPPSYDKLKIIYATRLADETRKEYVCVIDNQIVGCLSAVADCNCIEIGYGVLSSYSGKGVGTAIINYVIRDNQDKTIIAWVSDQNRGSEKCLEKNGFSKTLENNKRHLLMYNEEHTFYKWVKESVS